MISLLCLLVISTIARSVWGAIVEHEVVSYPLQEISFRSKHYSGLIELSGAHSKKYVHYVFIESETIAPENAPVTFWTNGGPGCSGLEGLFTEHGPYFINEEGVLKRNHHAWTRVSNMLYVEQPVGVGFSYTEDPIEMNDETAAELNLNFIVEWFKHYPEFKTNKFYLSGESYAGIYVPTFADEIVRYNADASDKINLAGVLIGNGCSGIDSASCGKDPTITTFEESAGGLQLQLAYNRALISKELFMNVSAICENMTIAPDEDCYVIRETGDPLINETYCWRNSAEQWECVLTNETDPMYDCCYALFDSEDGMGDINIYSIYGQCLPDPSENVTSSVSPHVPTSSFSRRRLHKRSHRRLSSSVGLEPPAKHGWSGCWGSDAKLTEWLNNDIVRKALHVVESTETSNPGHIDWKVCADFPVVNYTKTARNVVPLYVTFLENFVDVMIYSGDTDACVPFTGTSKWVDELTNNQTTWTIEDSAWTPWLTNKQVAGYRSLWTYKSGDQTSQFLFATVRGAGHMVPTDRPQQSMSLFSQYLSGCATLDCGPKKAVTNVTFTHSLEMSFEDDVIYVQEGTAGAIEVDVKGTAEWESDEMHRTSLEFVWTQNGGERAGLSEASHYLDSWSACDAGLYEVVVYDVGGTMVSNAVRVVVNTTPAPSPSPSSSSSSHAGAIVGSLFGGIVVGAMLTLAVQMYLRGRKSSSADGSLSAALDEERIYAPPGDDVGLMTVPSEDAEDDAGLAI